MSEWEITTEDPIDKKPVGPWEIAEETPILAAGDLARSTAEVTGLSEVQKPEEEITAKGLASYIPLLTLKGLQGLTHPLFAPLAGTRADTNKLVADAIQYWEERTPELGRIPDVGVGVSPEGKIQLERRETRVKELLGTTAGAAGAIVGPVKYALTAGGLVTKIPQIAARARPFYRSILRGMIGGTLIGEGDPQQTLQNMALFGVFEAVAYGIGKVPEVPRIIKESVPWRKMTIKERGLALQSLDNTIQNNPNISEGEILRRWNNPQWRKEALAKRITGEEPGETWGIEPEVITPEPPRVSPETQKQSFLTKITEDVADLDNPLTGAEVAFMGKMPLVQELGITQEELNAAAAKGIQTTVISGITEEVAKAGEKILVPEPEIVEIEVPEPEIVEEEIPVEEVELRPTDVEAKISKPISDRVLADAKLFGDRADTETLQSEGFQSLNRKNQLMILSKVRSSLDDPQILRSIVEAIPIDVMNSLIGKKTSPEDLLHDPSMLTHSLSVSGDKPISKPIIRFIDSLVGTVEGIIAGPAVEKPSLPTVVTPSAIERDTTISTTKGSEGHIIKTSFVAGEKVEVDITPTEAQKQAGNYLKGAISLYGFDISIENPKGSMREGVDRQGKKWSIEVKHPYGYILGTKGKDKDHLDVFIGPKPETDKVFVVDQTVPETGKFDEHKIMMGFETEEEARAGYLANYEKGWRGLGAMTEMTVDEFKTWTKEADTTKAIGEIKPPEKPKEVGKLTPKEVAAKEAKLAAAMKRKGVPAETEILPEELKGVPDFMELAEKRGFRPGVSRSATEWGVIATPEQIKLAKEQRIALLKKTEGLKKQAKEAEDFEEKKRLFEEVGELSQTQGQGLREAIEASEGIWPSQVDITIRKRAEVKPKAEVVKEPWEMGYKELIAATQGDAIGTPERAKVARFLRDYGERQGYKYPHPFDPDDKITTTFASKAHREAIQQAIKEGKITSHPDYPELGKKPPKVVTVAKPKAFKKRRTRYLTNWIVETGGVRDVTLPGELRDLITDIDAKGRFKRARGVPIGFLNKKGRGLDEIVDEARSAGFAIEDVDDLLAKLEKDMKASMEGDVARRITVLTDEAGLDIMYEQYLEDAREDDINEKEARRSIEREVTAKVKKEDEFNELADEIFEEEFNEVSEEVKPTQVSLIEKEAPFELKGEEPPPKLVGPLGKKAVFPTEKIRVGPRGEQVSLIKRKGEQVTIGEKIEEKDKFDSGVDKVKDSEVQYVYAPVTKKQQLSLFDFKPSGVVRTKEAPKTGKIPPSQRVRVQTTGNIKGAGTVLAGIDDAASLIAPIRKKAQEDFYSIAVDKDGTILEIHRYSKGTKGATLVSPVEVAGRALNVPNVHMVYFAHNHPTGDAWASREDISLTGHLEDLLKADDVRSYHIIISRTKYSVVSRQYVGYEVNALDIRPMLRKVSIPIKERYLVTKAELQKREQLTRVEDAIKAIKKHADNADGVLFLTNNNKPITFLPFIKGQSMKQTTLDIIKTAESVNANAIIINNNDISTQRTLYLEALARGRLGGELVVLDVIEKGESWIQQRRKDAMGKGVTEYPILLSETRLALEPSLIAEPEGYKFTKRQQKNLIEIGTLVPGWLKRAGADEKVLKNITLELKPFIDLRGKDVDKTLKDWEKEGIDAGTVLGATTFENYHALIQLAINGQTLAKLEKSTYHEWYHVAKAWMLPRSDIDALSKHFKTEESEADAFAKYMKDAKAIDPAPGFIKRLFLKLKRMINIIRNGLKGKGFNRPEDVFGSIRVRAYKPTRMGTGRARVGFLAEPEPVPPFYSQLIRAVEVAKDMPRKIVSLKNWLSKKAKPEELKWMDVERWIAENTKPDKTIDKTAFLDFLRGNEIEVREVTRGAGTFTEGEGALAIERALDIIGKYDKVAVEEISDAWEVNRKEVPKLIDDFNADNYDVMEAKDAESLDELTLSINDVVKETPPKYAQYTLPGGEAYRELLLTLPEKKIGRGRPEERIKEDINRELGEPLRGPLPSRNYALSHAESGTQKTKIGRLYDELDAFYDSFQKPSEGYRAPHWEEPNVLAHVRFNERTDAQGNKVLFLEEIQSDWLQEAKKKGFAPTDAELRKDRKQFVEIQRKLQKLAEVQPFDERTEAEQSEILQLGDVLNKLDDKWEGDIFKEQKPEKGVPPAPFLKNWHEFMMKRMLRYAAEHGFDKLGWTTGKQQSERYKLTKFIDRIDYAIRSKEEKHKWAYAGLSPMERGKDLSIAVYDKKGDLVPQVPSSMTWQEAEDHFGKEIARRMRAQGKVEVNKSLTGLGLEVGGEGMNAFYDRLLPGFMSKYVKQWGAKIGKTEIDTGKKARVFDIAEVKGEGWYVYTPDIQHSEDPGWFESEFLKTEEEALDLLEVLRGEETGKERLETTHSVPITEEMHKAVMFKGQTFFAMEKKPPTISKEEKAAEKYVQQALGKVKETKVVELKPTEKITGAAYDKIAVEEAQNSIDELITKAKDDERLIHHVRSTLKKAMSIGKKAGIAKQKAHYQEVVARAKARKEKLAQIRKMIDQLKAVDVETLSPQEKQPVGDLLAGINLVKPTKRVVARLTNTRRYLEDNPDAELPEYVMENLKRLDKGNIRDMSIEDIESLHKAVMHYVHLNKLKGIIKVRRESKRKAEVLSSSIGEMKLPKKIKSEIVSSQKSKLGKTKKTAKLITDTFGIRHDHYDLIIESLSGVNSTMDKVLYQEIYDGRTEQLKYKLESYEQFYKDLGDISAKYGISDISNWLNEQVTTGKFRFTRGERMALLRHALNRDNLRHLLAGGFGFRTSETPNKRYMISAKELNQVLQSLTPAEKHFAGTAVNNLFERQYKALNKVFYAKNNYDLPKTRDPYYPIEVMSITLGKDLETVEALEKFKGRWTRIGLEKGMLEKRIKSKKPIYLNSIAFDINRSVMKSAAYVGLEIPLSNASKLLYDRTFRAELENRYGKQTWREIEKGLRDIAGDYQSYTTVEEMALKLKNNLAVAMLGVNPFVMVKQVLSLPIYLPYVKAEYLIQGMIDLTVHSVETSERHKMYSPRYEERVEGGYSRDVADVFKGAAMKRLYKGKGTIKEKFMGGIQLFDRVAVSAGMQGAVLQVLDEFDQGKLSREVRIALDMKDADIVQLTAVERMKLAYKFADYATERTQPMWSPEHRSSLSRGATIEKLATMFGAFTNQALNLMRRTYREARRTGEPAAYTKLGKVLFLILVVNTLGVMAIDEIRDRITKKKKKPSIAARILNTWAGYMFFIRDLANSVISKVERGTFAGYDVQLPIQRVPELLSNVLANAVKAFSDKTPAKRKKAAMRFIDDGLNLLLMTQGIPYQTPKRLVAGAVTKKESPKY